MLTGAESPFLYLGGLPENEPQFKSGHFMGLTLKPTHEREIEMDLRYDTIPYADETIAGIQIQDVLEHLPLSHVAPLLNDCFRVLRAGGVLRLSAPDYNSPALLRRCVFDAMGNVIADLGMSTKVRFDRASKEICVDHAQNGGSHLWFPTYALMRDLVLSSKLRQCESINWLHYWHDRSNWTAFEFDHGLMPIKRCPPRDMRAAGAPVSIVIDFIK